MELEKQVNAQVNTGDVRPHPDGQQFLQFPHDEWKLGNEHIYEPVFI